MPLHLLEIGEHSVIVTVAPHWRVMNKDIGTLRTQTEMHART